VTTLTFTIKNGFVPMAEVQSLISAYEDVRERLSGMTQAADAHQGDFESACVVNDHLREEVERLEAEVREWRERYMTGFESFQKLQAECEELQKQLDLARQAASCGTSK